MSREKTASLQRCNPLKKQEIVNTYAKILVENGASINQAAEQSGLGRTTIKRIKQDIDKYGKSLTSSEIEGLQNSLADGLLNFAQRGVSALDGKLDTANLQQTMIAIATAIDKARLIKGLSTGRTETVNLTLHKIVQASNSGSVAGEVFKDVEAKEVKADE